MKHVILCIVFLALLLSCRSAWSVKSQTELFENGLRLTVLPTTVSQVVTVTVLINYSALDEPTDLKGIRQVLVTGMLQGSQDAGGTLIRQSLTSAGGILEGKVHQDALEFSATVPENALPLAFAALSEIIRRPQLSAAGIQWAIRQRQHELETSPIGALDTASFLAQQLLYAGHPYATNSQGTAETLAAITPVAVRQAYQSHVIPQATVVAVVGRCAPNTVREQVMASFAAWQGISMMPRPACPLPALSASRLELRQTPVKSTCVMLAFPVCGANDPDFLTLRLIDALLGDGTGARLFRSVREQRHLAYEVSTMLPGQAEGSFFALYALTSSNYLDDAKSALVDELARLQVELVPSDELLRAKAYVKGRYLLTHQYSAQHAFDLAWYSMLGLATDFDETFPAQIDAITTDDVQRVARQYFTRYYLVVIMPLNVGEDGKTIRCLSDLSVGVQHHYGAPIQ